MASRDQDNGVNSTVVAETTASRPRDSLIPRLRATVGTTPGRLTGAIAGLVVLSVVTGIIGLLSVQGTANTLDQLARSREPVSAAAEQIFHALSDADATAASGVLSDTAGQAALQKRYQSDITQASGALAVAAGDISGTDQDRVPLTNLIVQLPVYTGLIAQAAHNNQQGHPNSTDYLVQADNLMRTVLLPAAQQLYSAEFALVVTEQGNATSIPWAPMVLVAVLLVVLIITQRYIRHRTNRVLNLGLLTGTVTVIVAVTWAAIALITAGVHGATGRDSGSTQVNLLAGASSMASQARTDEMLTLVTHGVENYTDEFLKFAQTITGTNGSSGLLGQVRDTSNDPTLINQANTALNQAGVWLNLHAQVLGDLNGDHYDQAVNLALSTDTNGEATAFYNLDNTLTNAIEQARNNFITETDTAAEWLSGLSIGVLVLCSATAIGSVIGIWLRLREYR